MRFLPILATVLFAAAFCRPAAALESAPLDDQRATVSLVTDTDAYAPGQAFHAGLRIRLAPGWHTYWQNPGDAGAAPELKLVLPPGAHASAIAWPAPQALAEGPLMTYGYTGEVLLPVSITAPEGNAPLPIEAHATWLVCAKICVPEEGSFHVQLPPGTPAASPEAGLFAAAEQRIPRPAPWPAHIAPDATLWMTGDGLSPAHVRAAWFFPAGWGAIDDAAPQRLSVYDGGLALALRPGQNFHPQSAFSGVLVLRDPAGAKNYFQVNATPGAAPMPAGQAVLVRLPLLRVLALALLGGFILNLMPCVFPVLAMKALALARLSGGERGRVRAHAAAYAAGVLVAFVGLAAILLAARSGGSAAGWGFQFQSPAFVAAMCWLLFCVGLNLSGVFQIGGRLAGAGQHLAERGGHFGSFSTGLLAVLVATPCTAPFMGVAVAAGLAASAPVTLAVFVAMGVGLAAPYLALALVPALAHRLPRPGHWMDLFKQALAFPMYAATAWLLWVVSQEAGPAGVLGTATGLVLLGFAAWILGVPQLVQGRARRVGQSAAVASALAALAVLSGIAAAPPPGRAVAGGAEQAAGIEPFSLARLDALRAEGRPVFVDMTAAWCVTCLVNERLALSPAPVRKAFAEHRVAYLRGDWTRQDPDITAFLNRYGRAGVPLYVLYPGGREPPTVLPQLLTEAGMLEQLRRVGG